MTQNKIEHTVHSYAADKGWIYYNAKNAKQCWECWVMLRNADVTVAEPLPLKPKRQALETGLEKWEREARNIFYWFLEVPRSTATS